MKVLIVYAIIRPQYCTQTHFLMQIVINSCRELYGRMVVANFSVVREVEVNSRQGKPYIRYWIRNLS